MRPRTVVLGFLDFRDGGAQRHALDLAATLDRRRFRPVLLCARGDGELLPRAEAAGLTVCRLGRLRRPYDGLAVLRLALTLRKLRADVLQVPAYSRAAPYMLLGAAAAGVPLRVLHHHGHRPPPSAARRVVDHLTTRGARHVVVDRHTRAALLRAGVPAARLRYVPHGVDLDRFAPADRDAARRALGLPRAAPLVVVPARLVPVKGHADLVAAVAMLQRRHPELRVLCLGGGPLRAALSALATAAGLGETMRFLGARQDMPRWLAAANLVVLPSRMEGRPLALLEAHAAGRAVVATEVGGVGDIVAQGRSGRLVPPRRPAALAAAIADLLDDPAASEAMGVAARERAEARFGRLAATARMEAAWTRWLAPSDRRGLAAQAHERGPSAAEPRVLHVRTTHGRHGPERALMELAPALRREGVRPRLLALARAREDVPEAEMLGWLEEARAAGLPARAAWDPAPLAPAAWRAVARAARDADVVHSHDYRADLLLASLRLLGRLPQPWVSTVHLHTEATWRLRLWRCLDVWALRLADAVLTVSRRQQRQLAASGIPARRVHRMPNVIDAAAFAARADAGAAWRRRLGMPDEGGRLLVFVGRLAWQKGLDVLVAALPALCQQHAGLVVALAGEGPLRTGLEARVERLGLTPRVCFLGTVLDVPNLLAAADVVVLPSRREGLPLVLLEAMAVGATVVATDVGGNGEALRDGRTGRLVPAEDALALRRAVTELLGDRALAAVLGRAAAREVRRRYAPQPVARRLAALYRGLLAEATGDEHGGDGTGSDVLEESAEGAGR